MSSTTTILDRKTISIMKACELVGVSRRTIYNWIAAGKVGTSAPPAGQFGFSLTRSGASPTITSEAKAGATPTGKRPNRFRAMFDTGLQSVFEVTEIRNVDEPLPLSALFHRLNNQLGIVLAHAELLEAKLTDGPSRVRAGQVLASVMGALSTAKEIRSRLDAPPKEVLQP